MKDSRTLWSRVLRSTVLLALLALNGIRLDKGLITGSFVRPRGVVAFFTNSAGVKAITGMTGFEGLPTGDSAASDGFPNE